MYNYSKGDRLQQSVSHLLRQRLVGMRYFVLLVLVFVALGVHPSMAVKLCGRHLVLHVGSVCAATECDSVDETMPMSSFRGRQTLYWLGVSWHKVALFKILFSKLAQTAREETRQVTGVCFNEMLVACRTA